MAFVPCGIPINELLLILRLILKGSFWDFINTDDVYKKCVADIDECIQGP